MTTALKRLRSVLTEDGTLSMQRRLFRMICLTTALLCAVILPINALQNFPVVINISVLLFGLFTLLLFRETFRGRDHVITYFVVLLLVLNVIWFPNGGSMGSVIFYFAAALIYPMALMRGALRWILVGFLVLDAAALTTIDYFVPGLAVPFATSTARVIDLLTGIFCSALAGVAALWVVFTNYDWERAAMDRVSRELAVSEKNYREVVESASAAIVRMDRNGTITFLNSFAATLFGFERTKLIGLTGAAIFPPSTGQQGEEPSRFDAILRDPAKEVQFESKRVGSDGRMIWLSWTVQPIYEEEGTVAEFLCIGNEVTEQKALEEKRRQFDREMMQVQKLESLSILAGGIAHDFNNILAAVLGNISLVRTKGKPSEEMDRRLAEAEKASLHARDLTAQLLTFSRSGVPIKRPIVIGSIVREAITLSLRGSSVASAVSIAHDLWKIEADAGQLGQAFSNLIINASQAMPSGGTVTVDASNARIDENDGMPLAPGRYVKVEIRDEGTGIAADHLTKIFDPYFTTKQSSSGLGLAVTYSVIKNHKGHIAVRSTPGEGSVFTIYLPAMGPEPHGTRSTGRAAGPTGARVLIMEDEDAVRDTVVSILTTDGCTVEISVTGEEAIRRYKNAFEEGKPYDIVLMDLTIPGGMGAKETIRHLRELDPEVKAVATSGYANDLIMKDFRDYGFLGVIAKPFLSSELADLLRNILNKDAPAPPRDA